MYFYNYSHIVKKMRKQTNWYLYKNGVTSGTNKIRESVFVSFVTSNSDKQVLSFCIIVFIKTATISSERRKSE